MLLIATVALTGCRLAERKRAAIDAFGSFVLGSVWRMQNAAPLVQTAHLTPVAAQPKEPAARQTCPFSEAQAKPATESGGMAAALQKIDELPRPVTHLASLDLTPAPSCPKMIRFAKVRLQLARIGAVEQARQARVRVVVPQVPDAAAIEAEVTAAVAKAEAAQEIREIVIVSAPATL